MAIAKLHIICGNCGCNDMFEFSIGENEFYLEENNPKNYVHISCKNCCTLHDLSDNAELKD